MDRPNDNPYAAPHSLDAGVAGDQELAGRGMRFVGALIDGLLLAAIVGPVQYFTGFIGRQTRGQVAPGEQLVMVLLGGVVFLLLNGYLLASRGQTIGKMVTGIQIVDASAGTLLPFLRVYVYRCLWMTPLVIVTALIPGPQDDMLVNLVSLVDAVLIFGPARRCLHDHIAGSKVVRYVADRRHAASR